MSDPLYVNLQPGEQAITIAASNIYAAYVISGQAKADPEGMLKQAALEAIRLARTVDENVIAPGEMS
jgi:hypothetical protein